MERIAVYAGSFCPFTKGHEDIVRQALPLFDKIIIAIGENPDKKDIFDVYERLAWMKEIYQDNPKVHIFSYTGLTVELCQHYGARFLIRGVRNVKDFAAELDKSHDTYSQFELSSASDTIYLEGRNKDIAAAFARLLPNNSGMAFYYTNESFFCSPGLAMVTYSPKRNVQSIVHFRRRPFRIFF